MFCGSLLSFFSLVYLGTDGHMDKWTCRQKTGGQALPKSPSP
jgi:hypothetical protein